MPGSARPGIEALHRLDSDLRALCASAANTVLRPEAADGG
jgi:hypothetical protein